MTQVTLMCIGNIPTSMGTQEHSIGIRLIAANTIRRRAFLLPFGWRPILSSQLGMERWYMRAPQQLEVLIFILFRWPLIDLREYLKNPLSGVCKPNVDGHGISLEFEGSLMCSRACPETPYSAQLQNFDLLTDSCPSSHYCKSSASSGLIGFARNSEVSLRKRVSGHALVKNITNITHCFVWSS